MVRLRRPFHLRRATRFESGRLGTSIGVSNDPIEQPGDMDDADTANGENPYERDPDDPDTSDAADARRRLSEDDDRVSGPLG